MEPSAIAAWTAVRNSWDSSGGRPWAMRPTKNRSRSGDSSARSGASCGPIMIGRNPASTKRRYSDASLQPRSAVPGAGAAGLELFARLFAKVVRPVGFDRAGARMAVAAGRDHGHAGRKDAWPERFATRYRCFEREV